jgi:hypothetical protein
LDNITQMSSKNEQKSPCSVMAYFGNEYPSLLANVYATCSEYVILPITQHGMTIFINKDWNKNLEGSALNKFSDVFPFHVCRYAITNPSDSLKVLTVSGYIVDFKKFKVAKASKKIVNISIYDKKASARKDTKLVIYMTDENVEDKSEKCPNAKEFFNNLESKSVSGGWFDNNVDVDVFTLTKLLESKSINLLKQGGHKKFCKYNPYADVLMSYFTFYSDNKQVLDKFRNMMDPYPESMFYAMFNPYQSKRDDANDNLKDWATKTAGLCSMDNAVAEYYKEFAKCMDEKHDEDEPAPSNLANSIAALKQYEKNNESEAFVNEIRFRIAMYRSEEYSVASFTNMCLDLQFNNRLFGQIVSDACVDKTLKLGFVRSCFFKYHPSKVCCCFEENDSCVSLKSFMNDTDNKSTPSRICVHCSDEEREGSNHSSVDALVEMIKASNMKDKILAKLTA